MTWQMAEQTQMENVQYLKLSR